MRKLLSFFVLSVLILGCSGSGAVENGKKLTTIECKNNLCEVGDSFFANLPEIKKCIQKENPYIKKNYEGIGFWGRGIGYSELAEISARQNLAVVVPYFFNVLAETYIGMFGESIKKEISEVSTYNIDEYQSGDLYVKKILGEANISEVYPFGPFNEDVACIYFSFKRFIVKHLFDKMPKSFRDNIDSLLDITAKKVNKDIKAGNLKVYTKKYNFSKEKLAELDSMFLSFENEALESMRAQEQKAKFDSEANSNESETKKDNPDSKPFTMDDSL